MNDSVLTPERILAAAEDVLRRYGPGKATVVDVAQALGVSHGSVYRHFASKAELRDAVLRGWLARSMAPLQAIANSRTPPPARLRQWFSTLRQTKRDNVLGDPELFATYSALAAEARGQQQGQQLGLVADLGQRHGAGGNEQCVEHGELRAGRIREGREGKRRVARPGARRLPSVLPVPPGRGGVARHGDVPMNGRAKHVDARAAASRRGGLLPGGREATV
jgi:AcrR family transcriptional regulator